MYFNTIKIKSIFLTNAYPPHSNVTDSTYIHAYIHTLYYDSSIGGYSVVIYNNKITMGQKYLHLLQQEIFT